MPKPITIEMLHAMDADQRKTLHRNASGLDTPAAREVLALLATDDLMGKPKAPPKAAKAAGATSTARKTTARKPAAPRAAKPAAAAKPKSAVYGRQA